MLIVITGASSSGKSTLARAMQALAGRPLLHLEADEFVPALNPGGVTNRDSGFEARLIVGFHRAIAELGRSGLDVIVDGSLPDEEGLKGQCLDILRGVAGTQVIAVNCAAATLRRREAARGDRPRGWAVRQAAQVHAGVVCDLEVDTTRASPDVLARRLLTRLFQPA